MRKTIYDLQSAEWEKAVEMHYLLENGARSFDRLIDKGYGVYPEILTFMVSLGYGSKVMEVLAVAKKYDPYALRNWLEAYCGDKWKERVVFYKLEKIALCSFSSDECAKAGFWDVLKWKSDWHAKELLEEKYGIEHLKSICDMWRKQVSSDTATQEVKERYQDLERYLASRGEFAYLRLHKSWLALNRQFEAFKYMAGKKDYSGIMLCVIYGGELTNVCKCFIKRVLDHAELNEEQKECYSKLRSGCLLRVD